MRTPRSSLLLSTGSSLWSRFANSPLLASTIYRLVALEFAVRTPCSSPDNLIFFVRLLLAEQRFQLRELAGRGGRHGNGFARSGDLHAFARLQQRFLVLRRHIAELGLAENIQLLADKLGSEAHILAAASDGLGQVLVADDDDHPAVADIGDLLDVRGRQAPPDIAAHIIAPVDDIDALVGQLAHDGLHAVALHAHAGAHGVDAIVLGGDCD